MSRQRRKISQRAALRMRREIAHLRDAPLAGHASRKCPLVFPEPKTNARAWIQGAIAGGAIVTVIIRSDSYVFTAHSAVTR